MQTPDFCMFAAQERDLQISFGAAQARLVNLPHGRRLSGASQRAYDGGLAQLIRVGPLGEVPGASKLVRVRFLDPVYRDGTMTLVRVRFLDPVYRDGTMTLGGAGRPRR